MKTVLITGCSSGLGLGMVEEFLNRGWRVFCTMRNSEQRRYILAEFLEKYPELTLLELEVTNKIQRDAVVQTIEQNGKLDCLVNNAGFGLLGALEDLSEEQIRQQMEVNFCAPVFLTRALLPLLRHTQGNVIFISSVCGYIGFPLMSAYCASKYSLEGFAESLYHELEPQKVDVTLIELGLTKSNFRKNVIWGIGQNQAYRQMTKNYHLWQDKLTPKSKNNVPLVARKVADIADKRVHQFRVRVGEEAIFTHFVKRILPELIWLKALKMLFRRNTNLI
jgi:NAD(P)-dependent dehydrogenase (short-subunit alcohol dehydrogenase family)